MTNQEIFDKVYLGLKSQGFKRSLSLEVESICKFRGFDGRRCAIGWLIPDEEYAEMMESEVARTRLMYCEDAELGAFLMESHDNGKSPDQMVSRLKDTAAYFGLTVPE